MPRVDVKTMEVPDVQVSNEGTIFLFELGTDAAVEWVKENVAEPKMFMGTAVLVVEHRYARDLAEGMIASGLMVR